MKKKNGFTLIELLAVIVILAIILLIAIPNILTVIEKAREDSFKSSLEMIMKQIEYEMLQEGLTYGGDELVYETSANITTGSISELNISQTEGWLGSWNWDRSTRVITLSNVSNGTFTGHAASNQKQEEFIVYNVGSVPPPILAYNEGNSSETIVYQGDGYAELGASASDYNNEDIEVIVAGDVVDDSTPGVYTVTYTATDDNTKTTTLTNTVTVVTYPVVSLEGITFDTITQGQEYSDLGATALDYEGNSLVVNEVNLVAEETPGVYTITYTATDTNGKSSSSTRTVTVVALTYNSNNNFTSLENNTDESIDISVTAEGITATNIHGTDGNFEIDSDSDGVADNFTLIGGVTNGVLSTDSIYGNYSQQALSDDTDKRVHVNRNNYAGNGNLLYVSAWIKNEDADMNALYRLRNLDINDTTQNEIIAASLSLTAGEWGRISGVGATEVGTENTITILELSNAGSFETVLADGLTQVDLTATFGAGNEITTEEADYIFPNYFDNTTNTNVTFVSEGKNLLNIPNDYSLTLTNSTSHSSDLIAVIPVDNNMDYYLSGDFSKTGENGHGGFEVLGFTNYPEDTDQWFMSTNTDGERIAVTEQPTMDVQVSFNAGDYNYVAIYLGKTTRDTTVTFNLTDWQLEEGTNATDYEAYTSTSTVLDITSGTSTITIPLLPSGRIYKTVNTINTTSVNYVGN